MHNIIKFWLLGARVYYDNEHEPISKTTMPIIHHTPAPPPFLFPHFIKCHGFNGNCQALGPVPGQSQISFSDSQKKGPVLTL